MAELRIPPQQRHALQTFVALSTDSTEALRRALQDAKPTLTPAQLARQIEKKVDIPFADIREILQLIASLLITVYMSKKAKEAIAADVARAISHEQLTGKELTPDEIDSMKSKLLSFFQLPILGIAAKATDVYVQHKNVFRDARVLTDIRPIFSEEDLLPVACVIIHQLEIETYTDRSRVSYFAALDSTDLKKLRAVLDRAFQKEAALKKNIDQSGLSYLDIDGES